MIAKWHKWFLTIAKETSKLSRDPSTKCGACIFRPDNTLVSVGYNGFAPGVNDSPEKYNNREEKYEKIIHCEVNCVLSAKGQNIEGFGLATFPFLSCSRCCAIMIRAGIKQFITIASDNPRWQKSFNLTREQCTDANINIIEYSEEEAKEAGLL